MGIGRPAVRGVVLEATVLRRVVRRRDHDPVGEPAAPAAVVPEHGVRHDRGRREAVPGIDHDVDPIGSQDLERGREGRLRERVRIEPDEQGAVDPRVLALEADRLGDCEDVVLVEGGIERGAAMPGGPEHDPLRGHGRIRLSLVVSIDEARDVDEDRRGSGLSGERADLGHVASVYFTTQGLAFQISAAYSLMVRSLENFPDPATLRMALRAQPSGSAYSTPRRSLASRYDRRSARCMK